LLYYGLLEPSPHLKALVIVAIAGCALIVATHHENINRLMHGTENKVGVRVKPDSAEVGSSESAMGGRRS
jgi:hypothetical protein